MKGSRVREEVPDFPSPFSTAAAAIGLCAAFAVLYALGMPGYGIPGLPFVCLVPLLVLSTSAAGIRQAAWRGLLAGTLASLLLVYWIAYTVAVLGKLGWVLGGLAAFLVSAYMGAYISLFAAFAHRLRMRFGAAGLWGVPLAWVCTEYARAVLFTGFPWVLFGYSLSDRPLLRQAADLGGVYGLGFLLAAANVCFYRAAADAARRERRSVVLHLAGGAAIALFLLAYGVSARTRWGGETPDGTVRVGIAQGGIDQSIKWDPSRQKETVELYGALTAEAKANGASLVVWPETAAPFFYGWETEMSAKVDAIAAENRTPIIFGAPWFDPSDGGKYYNSVFLLGREGIPQGRYDKRHLVPFGEYIPFRGVFFFLRKLTEGEEDFSAGAGPALFAARGGPVGASVCYEAVFPRIIRSSVREGAAWLVNVTNDAWFGDTVAPRQHLAMAKMRSVEFRRPMVRAANSGISAVIDERGDVVADLGLFRRGTIVAGIRPRSGQTVYAKSGELFAVSCTIINILLLIFPGGRAYGSRGPGRKSRFA